MARVLAIAWRASCGGVLSHLPVCGVKEPVDAQVAALAHRLDVLLIGAGRAAAAKMGGG